MTRHIKDSLSLTPLHGLILLGLAAVLVEFFVWGQGGALQKRDVIPEDCVYEVYQDDRALGTVFFREAENLSKILSMLGVKAPSRENCGRIPCNRSIRLNSANETVFVDKIQGSHLIAAGKRVDVNLADGRDLEAVPGIGPRLSERIISVRNSKGGFRSLDDLRQVPGIGHKKLSDMTQYLEINSPDISGESKDMESRSRFFRLSGGADK